MREPILTIDGIKLLNVPEALEVANEVITDDCYEIGSIPNPSEWLFVDAGAFYGEASLFAANRGMECEAIEPSPLSYKILCENINLNGLIGDKIQPSNCKVGDTLDYRSVHHYCPDHPSGSGGREGVLCSTLQLELSSFTSPSNAKGKRVALKMDIEGGEVELFKSHWKWLPHVDFIAMECHNYDGLEYADILSRNGFKVTATGAGPKPRPVYNSTIAGGLIIGRRN